MLPYRFGARRLRRLTRRQAPLTSVRTQAKRSTSKITLARVEMPRPKRSRNRLDATTSGRKRTKRSGNDPGVQARARNTEGGRALPRGAARPTDAAGRVSLGRSPMPSHPVRFAGSGGALALASSPRSQQVERAARPWLAAQREKQRAGIAYTGRAHEAGQPREDPYDLTSNSGPPRPGSIPNRVLFDVAPWFPRTQRARKLRCPRKPLQAVALRALR